MIKLEEMSMLTTLYTQPHRHYHNINHINDCLVELENLPKDMLHLFERNVVETAIWWHDAVYNPYSKKNEQTSADMFDAYIGVETPFAYAVRQAILATANHTITQKANPLFYIDNELPLVTEVMLDIDLSGFGKSWEICKQNADNIRKEYYNTEDFEFYQGRLKFLEAISQRESLYYTDVFRDMYHEQSRENLRLDLAEIRWNLDRLDPH
jgi:predicted metal-dependent HD superfamily phosphohydrolase